MAATSNRPLPLFRLSAPISPYSVGKPHVTKPSFPGSSFLHTKGRCLRFPPRFAGSLAHLRFAMPSTGCIESLEFLAQLNQLLWNMQLFCLSLLTFAILFSSFSLATASPPLLLRQLFLLLICLIGFFARSFAFARRSSSLTVSSLPRILFALSLRQRCFVCAFAAASPRCHAFLFSFLLFLFFAVLYSGRGHLPLSSALLWGGAAVCNRRN